MFNLNNQNGKGKQPQAAWNFSTNRKKRTFNFELIFIVMSKKMVLKQNV
jgi:hypothetical protein